jgi:hypothetical protein
MHFYGGFVVETNPAGAIKTSDFGTYLRKLG